MSPENPPLAASAGFLLVVAGRAAQRRLESGLAEHGLTLRHLGALGHLSRNPELSYSDLARRSGVTAQSMHATVRALEELGAVRRRHEGHGHPARLEVTGKGRDLLGAAGRLAEKLDEDLLAGLTPEQRAEFRRLLQALVPPPG
ncbi:MarR family winged helix-turn-helix transcriptional regulator [Amycolatopsis nigrescens]|uniref:MarR family winged helix-turn-helix transcriptional regulator n=1 Tax=Amycolatopsis nigrescens TaxID=381445 RepID=UPI000373FFDD|nr:MarR family winged helix-turn-helix transcriptional regulator [Amycolatopsis nigrescens]